MERYQRWLFHYRKPKTGEPLSVHSQRSYLAAIRPFFKWLVQQRYLLANPASELVIPRRIKHLPRDVLTAEEAEAVLRQPDLADPLGVRDRVILESCYATAIHRVELVRLKEGDDLLPGRHPLFVDHPAVGLVDDPLGQGDVALHLRRLGTGPRVDVGSTGERGAWYRQTVS